MRRPVNERSLVCGDESPRRLTRDAAVEVEAEMRSWSSFFGIDCEVRWCVVMEVVNFLRRVEFHVLRSEYEVLMRNLGWFGSRVFVTMDQVADDEFEEVTRGWSVWVRVEDTECGGRLEKLVTVDFGEHAFRLAVEYIVSKA